MTRRRITALASFLVLAFSLHAARPMPATCAQGSCSQDPHCTKDGNYHCDLGCYRWVADQ
jgi:hypothetical protein